MSRGIWILVFSIVLWVASAQEHTSRFIAELPNGSAVELVGLRDFSALKLSGTEGKYWKWWRADGSLLDGAPDETTWRTSTSYSYYFVVDIKGCKDCSCIAVGPWGKDINPRPVREPSPGFDDANDLRWFTLRFNAEQKIATIRIGLATDDWTVVQDWPFWENASPYHSFFSSDEEVILRCPEQRKEDVVVEVTHAFANEATRLRILDKDGEWRESKRYTGGEGGGLIRYIHTFDNFNVENIERIEFQKRPYYYWIAYKNVSLVAEQRTAPEIEVKQRREGLIGKALPKLGQASIDSAIEKLKGQKVLLCFWDVAQRPSRNCIQRLAGRSEYLAQNGINLILIHVGSEQTQSPVQWLEKSNIHLTTEAYDGGVVKARLICGVRSLPWLVLADSNHVVCMEGVGLNELSQILKETKDGPD